jgi:hypothetical protein
LCLGRSQTRPPELVGDEPEHEYTDGDERPTDAADGPTPVAPRGG